MNWCHSEYTEIRGITGIDIKIQICIVSKYTYEDVCRLLEWETNEIPLNIGGYKYDEKQIHSQYL